VKLDTVLDHTLLNRQRCLDSVAGSRCGGLWLGVHHANTGISALPEPAAVFTDGGIPLDKVGKGNLVVVNNALAGSRILDEVPLVAVGYHTVLDRRRRLYSIRRSSDSWAWLDGCGRRWGRTDDTDTCISVLPEPAIVFTNSRIPLNKVGKGDLVIVNNALARSLFSDKVPFVAIGHHALLNGLWCFDPIALGGSCCGLWLGGRSQRWGGADDTDACVGVSPEPGAVFADSGIPLEKFGKGDLIIVENTLTTGCGRNIVELVAAGHHAFLDSVWGFDAIARRLLGSRGLLGNGGFDRGSRCLDARRHLGRSRNCAFGTNGGR
jgi:hypothetical protein